MSLALYFILHRQFWGNFPGKHFFPRCPEENTRRLRTPADPRSHANIPQNTLLLTTDGKLAA